MVDVVRIAYAVDKVKVIGNGCNNIVDRDMLRHKLIGALSDSLFKLVGLGVFEDILQNIEADLFVYTVFCKIALNIAVYIDHAVTDNLYFLFLGLELQLACRIREILLDLGGNICLIDSCLFDLGSLCLVNEVANICHDLAGHRVNDRS